MGSRDSKGDRILWREVNATFIQKRHMAVIGRGKGIKFRSDLHSWHCPDRRQAGTKVSGCDYFLRGRGSQGVLPVEHLGTLSFGFLRRLKWPRNRLELALGRKQPSIATNHLGLKK
jgi:hypothetical protein